ncbi:MAG: hypothetical protein KDA91_22115 [Planctomycetaceae bacterium]|nr:hypothetical protein [Planctomycetaceae bacterium]
MPRTSRASLGGFVDHVLNQDNGGSDVFHKDDDFTAFVILMQQAHEKVPMRLIGYRLNDKPVPPVDVAASRCGPPSLDAVADDVSRLPLSSAL